MENADISLVFSNGATTYQVMIIFEAMSFFAFDASEPSPLNVECALLITQCEVETIESSATKAQLENKRFWLRLREW